MKTKRGTIADINPDSGINAKKTSKKERKRPSEKTSARGIELSYYYNDGWPKFW